MQAHCQSVKFRVLGWPYDFSKLPLEGGFEERALVQGFAVLGGSGSWDFPRQTPLSDQTGSIQAENLDRNVVRAAAFPSQFNELAARLFHALVGHGLQNFRVMHQPPQSVGADHENVF